jgi:hypothetical protein
MSVHLIEGGINVAGEVRYVYGVGTESNGANGPATLVDFVDNAGAAGMIVGQTGSEWNQIFHLFDKFDFPSWP